MQSAFFYLKGIQKIFWKTIDFVKNLEMTQIAGGGGIVFFASLCVMLNGSQCVRKSI